MTQLPENITRIESAQITFPEGEVLATYRDVLKRSKLIHEATYLGNIEHKKVSILFVAEGPKMYTITTTIWLHYAGKIFLKGDITIPVERILEIQIP